MKLLYAKVTSIGGDKCTFHYNGSAENAEIEDLIRHITGGTIIYTCDENGNHLPLAVSFIKENLIRVVVESVDAKVDPKAEADELAKQGMLETINEFAITHPPVVEKELAPIFVEGDDGKVFKSSSLSAKTPQRENIDDGIV